jgi:hypothetical protein
MWPELALAGVSGIANMMSNGDNMTPEQRKVWQLLMGRYGVAQNVQGQIDSATQGMRQQANQVNASEDASMARRGMPVSPGQTALAHADTNASFGKSLSQMIPEIQRNSKLEQERLLGEMSGLSSAAAGNDNNDMANTLGDLSQNVMYAWLMRKRKQNSASIGSGSPLGDWNTGGGVYS